MEGFGALVRALWQMFGVAVCGVVATVAFVFFLTMSSSHSLRGWPGITRLVALVLAASTAAFAVQNFAWDVMAFRDWGFLLGGALFPIAFAVAHKIFEKEAPRGWRHVLILTAISALVLLGWILAETT